MIIDGVEYVLVPKVATEEMIADMLAANDFDAIWPAAIAAAPQPRVAVTDEAAKNIGRELWIKEREAVYPGLVNLERGRLAIAAVQSELGPALGMTTWREPTREECADIIKAYYNTPVDNFGRAMFVAVKEVLGGGE